MSKLNDLLEAAWEFPTFKHADAADEVSSDTVPPKVTCVDAPVIDETLKDAPKIVVFKDPSVKSKAINKESIQSATLKELPSLSSFKTFELINKITVDESTGLDRSHLYKKKLEQLLPKTLVKKPNMPLPMRIGMAKKQKERDTKEIQYAKETGMYIKKKKSQKTNSSASHKKNDVGLRNGVLKLSRTMIKSIKKHK